MPARRRILGGTISSFQLQNDHNCDKLGLGSHMRKADFLILFALAGIVALVYYVVRTQLPIWKQPPPQDTAKQSPVVPPKKPEATPKASRPQPVPVEPEAIVEVAKPPAPPPPAKPHPVGTQIPPGTPRAALIASYGEPKLKATSVERNHLLETFVYMEEAKRSATIVQLSDSKVIGASTSIY